ncbi:glutathione-specific gamma-glutamylcyclotransferase 1-like [Solea senegalensis]|uniref:Gamma-glutamylcyclotransferase n=2 Tax=Solea senegalensis TaxID=28829 RepID=A0AAV6RXR8_SOLSE|nr:glutathione-specific gamma-glutamylcyclotransferase 1-like [Solea senegalensis]
MWIFGYGSLVWKPGFAFQSSKIGFIKGYKRRFWHGDDFYRGDKERPARVATLVEDWDAHTWGVAYEVTDSHAEESLQYLNMREVVLGGYVTQTVEFTPKDGDQAPLLALVYIATASNPIYLGPASDKDIAAQVAVCSGKTGPNVEYVVRLAEFMRLFCPEVDDEHLFSIEAEVLNIFSDSGGIESPKQNAVLLKA